MVRHVFFHFRGERYCYGGFLLRTLTDRRKFIRLAKLLRKNRGPNLATDRPVFTLNDSGQVSAGSSSSSRNCIDSFNSWLEAFLLYMKFMFFYHADHVVKLTAYVNAIRGMAVHRPLSVWLKYDRKFRERMRFSEAAKHGWCYEDLIILSEVLQGLPTIAAKPPKRFDKPYCCNYGDPNHNSPACPRSRNPTPFVPNFTQPAHEKLSPQLLLARRKFNRLSAGPRRGLQ